MNHYAVWYDFNGVEAVEVIEAATADAALVMGQALGAAHPILRVVCVGEGPSVEQKGGG